MPSRQLDQAERLSWLQLIQSENVGPKTFFELLSHFGSVDHALEAAPELSRRGGARRAIKICPRDNAAAWLEKLQAYGGDLIAFGEEDYPTCLTHIDPPPPVLCLKGKKDLARRPVVSIVGSRKASAIGLKLAREYARDLTSEGIVICSGLARGIDTAAHEASLSGGTIAVLAGGIDHIYPPENAKLHNTIGQSGLLISEMMPGTVPQAQNFPRRNRIISGVSIAVIVVEAARKSGSLITARFAAEQGRDVFAVPGSPLDPRAAGTNHLIQNGASLALKSEDILDQLSPQLQRGFDETVIRTQTDLWNGGQKQKPAHKIDLDAVNDTSRENFVSLLSTSPVDVNDLLRETDVSPSNIYQMILELELAGRLTRHAGNQVSLNGYE